MPLAGGLVLFPVSIFGLLLISPSKPNLIYIVLATTVIFLIGLWDDMKGIHFSTKFVVQIAAALLVMQSGVLFDLDRIFFLKSAGIHTGLILSGIFTVVWIVGITNAVNLIDGVDGLAGGLSLNAFAGIGALSLASGSLNPAVHCIVMVGGILGFMRYNIYPARTFLGDSGSLLLGFSLAVASIQQSAKTSTFLVLGVPVLLLAIPMLDTSLAFSRRAINGKNPFRADREHLHHRLLELNFTTTQVLGIFYGLSAFLGILGVALAQTVKVQILALAIFLLVAILTMVRFMQIYNIAGLVRDLNIRIRTVAMKAVGSSRNGEERLKKNMTILMLVSTVNIFMLLKGGLVYSPMAAVAMTLFALGAMELYLNKVEDAPRYEITRASIFFSLVLSQIIFMTVWQGDYGMETLHIFGTITVLVLLGWFLYKTGTLAVFLTDPVDVLALYLGALGAGVAKHYLGAPSLVPFGIALANALVIYALIRVYLAGYRVRSKKEALGFVPWIL
jgi:UDP-GlcNAc:undecaprenyl-phosphate GlcNAc-1-phosphate transferase